jgi:hypothetical protein
MGTLVGGPEEPTSVDGISATYVEVGVNFGDHGQDVTTAVEVLPDDTVRDLMERVISRSKWSERKYANHIVLRFIQPVPRHAESAPTSTPEPF